MTDEKPSDGPIVMDLGDFIEEQYELRLSINGRKYVIKYGEARVDEVFRLIAKSEETDPEKIPVARRRIVTEFYKQHLAEGDPAQFVADIQTVPYLRPGAPFDIERLHQPLLMRVKKKRPWGQSEPSKLEGVWMTRNVAFLMQASKGALSHEQIMRLTYRQFLVYLDSFTWLMNEQSEEGRKTNRKNDLKALVADPRAKGRKTSEVTEVKRKLEEFNKRWEGKKGQTVASRQL